MLKQNALTKELNLLMKKRNAYSKRYMSKKELTPELASKIPPKLRATLNASFAKAFELIYTNGTPLIDKTYNKQNAEQQYQINQYAYELKQDKKAIRAFSRQSNTSNSINLLISGVEGIGLGLVGCGIPDIPLLTAVILRSLNEISINYGYDYSKPEEQLYQLLIIQGAMSYGDDLQRCFEQLDSYTQAFIIPSEEIIKAQIKSSASSLAEEMLFLKFVQGIPIVGVIGGISDTVFLHRIQRFAKLNYQYRLLKKLDN
jgi:hypothetical protein